MQALNSGCNPQDFEPKVRQFAPMVENLSMSERFALVKLIMAMPFNFESTPKKAYANHNLVQKRFNRFPRAITLSDDFEDYLGDDFWLGENFVVEKIWKINPLKSLYWYQAMAVTYKSSSKKYNQATCQSKSQA